MLYLAIAIGFVVGFVVTTVTITLFGCALGQAAKRGDEQLAEYNRYRDRFYSDDWDEGLELLWKWKEEPERRGDE
jgi:hypothetical protein